MIYSFKASGDYAPTFVSENIKRLFEFLNGRKFHVELPSDMRTGNRGELMAAGGISGQPRRVTFGEAGREALVPLDRPLSQVSADVRALSAFAQGIPFYGGSGGTTNEGNRRQVTIMPGAITVASPSADPWMVAEQTLDYIAARI